MYHMSLRSNLHGNISFLHLHIFPDQSFSNYINILFNFAFVNKDLFFAKLPELEIRLPLKKIFPAQVNKALQKFVQQFPVYFVFLFWHVTFSLMWLLKGLSLKDVSGG